MASILKVDTIQDQAGNNIISENANVITIGASGDTITVPAGATVSGFTSAGIDDNATSTAITIDSSENVGIGTTSMLAPLVVSNGGASGFEFHPEIATNTNRMVAYNRSSNAYNIFKLDALQYAFNVSGSEKITIDSSGNLIANSTKIGIGTNNPIADLSIVDSTTSSGVEIQPEVTTDTNRLTNYDRGDNSYKNFRLDGLTHQFYTSGSERMRLNSTGLGIGTSSPGAKLEIQTGSDWGNIINSTYAGTQYLQQFEYNGTSIGKIRGDNSSISIESGGSLQLQTANTERMRITSAGNILVGSTVNDSTDSNGQTIKGLVLSGNNANGTYTYLRLLNRVENATTSNGVSIAFDHAVSASTKIPLSRITASPESSTAGTLKFFTSTSSSLGERMRLTSTGLGLGTSSPSYKLDVPSVSGARLAKSNVFLAKEVTVTNGQTKTIDIATNNGGSYFKVIITGIYASNAGLWTTHEYEKVYVNSTTGGGNSAISTVYSQNGGNFQFQSGDFAISRPGSGVVRITYTENASNNGDIYLNVNVIGLGGRDVPSAITIT